MTMQVQSANLDFKLGHRHVGAGQGTGRVHLEGCPGRACAKPDGILVSNNSLL
jgi:hypothetical protein